MSVLRLSYRTCVLGGAATGIAVATIFSATPLLWIAVATFAVCVALFLAAMTKVLFGVESYSFLHYQLTTIAVTALIYAPALDSLALALAIAQAIGRIGCASAGCCSRTRWTRARAVRRVGGVVRHRRAHRDLRLRVLRRRVCDRAFTLEYFRDDERRHWLGVSEAQWICALSAVAILIVRVTGGHA